MRQIIAMGGGGFSMEPDNLALDLYTLQQARKPRPSVCFLPTASGDADLYALGFYRAFSQFNCRPSELSLFRLPTADLESYVLEKDILYVGGGNTRNMITLWREWGLDAILAKALEAGVILAGLSAGANCWFEQCTTDAVPGQMRLLACLGLLPGSFSPHYDAQPQRRLTLHRLLKEGQILPGYAADDGAALHFVDGQVFQAVCSRPNAKAYRVECAADEVTETALAMNYLR
jgi:dipeptidase E